ncbi:MAG: threonine ammonia-lyase [Chloroflexi bacterium]|nr:threonine ammonia-lyase [Chloroflexota bacterium]
MVTLDAIREARARIAGVVHHTPLIHSNSLSLLFGSPIYLKAENLQRSGSFKVRGAFNKLAQISGGRGERGVVTASAGNHAQGVALAAARAGLPATVVMPETASLAKYEATLGYGARVIRHGSSYDEALAKAQALAQEQGLTFVSAFDDEAIVAGQGTLGLELLEDQEELELVLVPVGGGGLVAGIATVIKSLRPRVTVIGVQARAAPALARSFHAGRRIAAAPQPTIADGIAIGRPGRIPLALVRRFVDDVVTVDEEAISHAVVLLLERCKLLVEAAGAVGLAALLSERVLPQGRATALVLSGGNLDVALLARIVEHGLSEAGRHMIIQVKLPDRPGELAHLLAHLAELKVNIIEVEHHRTGLPLPVGAVEIQLTLEIQNRSHGEEVRERLRSLGYREQALRHPPRDFRQGARHILGPALIHAYEPASLSTQHGLP